MNEKFFMKNEANNADNTEKNGEDNADIETQNISQSDNEEISVPEYIQRDNDGANSSDKFKIKGKPRPRREKKLSVMEVMDEVEDYVSDSEELDAGGESFTESEDFKERENYSKDDFVPEAEPGGIFSGVDVSKLEEFKRNLGSDVMKDSAEEETASLEQENKGESHEDEVEEKEEEEESYEENEKSTEKAEYLRLKKEFKSAEKAYYDAIEEDYTDRNLASRFFGLGRYDMSFSVQESYDKFMAANKSYYEFAQTSGVYRKMEERLNRNKSGDETVSINSAVAGRHVLTPAEKRLELQTVKMPEGLVKLKDGIVNKIKTHPKVAFAVVGASMFLNPAAVVTGFTTRYLGNKFYVNPIKEAQEGIQKGVVNLISEQGVVDLESMEKEYFAVTNKAHNAKNHVNMAAAGAAIGAGTISANISLDSITDEIPTSITDDASHTSVLEDIIDKSFDSAGEESVEAPVSAPDLPKVENVTVDNGLQDEGVSDVLENIRDRADKGWDSSEELHADVSGSKTDVALDTLKDAVKPPPKDGFDQIFETGSEMPLELSVESVPVSANEAISEIEPHIVESGENTSTILFNSLKESPTFSDMDGDVLAHKMYQTFPEMTDATNIQSRLTPQQWVDLGVKSGDPNLIHPGETINLDELVRIMQNSQPEQGLDLDTNLVPDQQEIIEDEVTTSVLESEQSADVVNTPMGGESQVAAETSVEVADVITEEVVPRISENYENLIHTMKVEDMNGMEFFGQIKDTFTREQINPLHEILVETLQRGLDSGDIILPDPLIVDGVDYSDNLVGYVAEKLPDVSRDWSDVFESDKLTPEQWKSLGIRSGDPNQMYLGETIKIGELLKFVMRDELASVSQDGSLTSEAVNSVVTSGSVSGAGSAETVSDTLSDSVQDGIGGETSGNQGDVLTSETSAEDSVAEVQDNSAEASPEISSEAVSGIESEFKLSENYGKLTHEFLETDVTIHDYLAQVLEQGVKDGNIILPDPLIVDGKDFSNNMLGFVEEKLPDVSRSLAKIHVADKLTPEQWQLLGVDSGDPQDIYLGETVDIGKLLKFIVNDEPVLFQEQGESVLEAVGPGSTSPALLEQLRATVPDGYIRQDFPDGGERWTNPSNENDFMEIKANRSFYSQDYLNSH